MKTYDQFRADAPASVAAVIASIGLAVAILAAGVLFIVVGFGHAGLAVTDSALERAMLKWGLASLLLSAPLLLFAIRRRSFLLLMLAASAPLFLGLAAIYVVLRV